MMGSGHRLAAGQHHPSAVTEKEAVAASGLEAHMLPAVLAQSLSPVQLHAGQVQQPALASEQLNPHFSQAAALYYHFLKW